MSHDRHLLRAATETLWLVRGGHVSAYDGDLDDYAELVLSDRRDRAAAQKEENRSAAAPVVTQKEARREAAKEDPAKRNPKFQRELFRVLREALLPEFQSSPEKTGDTAGEDEA